MTSRARRAPLPARWLAAVALAVTAACGGDAAGPGPGPVSAAHSVVTVSRAVLVSGTLAELLLETRDATGHRVRVGGRIVVFAAAGGTSAGVVSPTTDQGDGTYSASFIGVTAGTPTTIGATVDGQAVTQPLPTIEVVPGPLSPIASFVTVTPRTIVPGGQATFTLVTADVVGNELGVGGHDVRFAVFGGTSAGTIGPVTDHATGRYTAAFTATVMGTPLTVGATVDGVPVAPPLPILTVAHGVSADSSTVSVSSDTVTLHGSVAVTLHVRDSAGVARHSGGEVVAFFVLSGARSGLGTIDSAVDHDDGTYTATFTATATGQPVGIGATLNGRAAGGTAATVTILPVALAPQKSTVRISRNTVAAGGSATFALEVRDLDSNRVTAGGLAVRFTLDDDGTSAGAIGPTTDHDDGSYSATFTGTAAGTPVTVGATINDSTRVEMLDTLGVSHLPTVTVDPGPPAPDSSLLAASPGQVELGDSATLRLETRDAYGNPLRSGGRSVAFHRAGGFGVSAGRIGAVTDRGDGSYSARYRADTAGRADTIRATVDGTLLTSARPTITVVCTAASVSPSLSEVTVNDNTAERAPVTHVTLPSGVSTTVTLWARDYRACPVTVPVTVVMTAGGGTSSGVLGAVVDQGDGTYIAAFTGATAGTATAIVATVNGTPVTSSPATISVVPGDISSQTSVVTASRAAVDSGARATVRLRARDAAGNDLTRGGRGVTFAVAGAGHGTVGPTTDRGDGTYTAEYTGHIVDPGRPDTITARIEGTPVHTPLPAIAVVAGTISPAQSVVTVAGGTVAAGDSVRVALRGRDAAGRALVTGDRPDAIAFTQNGGSTGVFQAVSNGDDGSYETFFHGRVAGGATTIGATIAGALVTTALPAVTVTAGPAAVTTSRVVVAADSVGVGDTTTIELEVFDAFGNAVTDPGLTVVFAVAPSGVGAVSAAAYRSSNRYAARFTALAPGTALVGASIGGAAVTTAPAVVRVK